MARKTASTDESAAGNQFESLSSLLDALRGEGWVRASPTGGDHIIGFEIDGFVVERPRNAAEHDDWTDLGSWAFGAGRGYRARRTRVGRFLVDWVDLSEWDAAGPDSVIAVHEKTAVESEVPRSRGVKIDDWQSSGEGSRRLEDVISDE